MRVLPRIVWLLVLVTLLVAVTGCAKKKEIKLEMTRETVLVSPTIGSVVLDPSGRIDTRDGARSVTVTMQGDSGLTATFDVSGMFSGRSMDEVDPGTYRGSFDVPQGHRGDLWITTHLVHGPSGAKQQMRAAAPLSAYESQPVVQKNPCEDFDAQLRQVVVYFKYDNHLLDDAGKALLTQNSGLLGSTPECRVMVLGHTDTRGDDQYNHVLSMRRAIEVGQFLESLGVAGDRIEKHFMGKEHPVTTEDSREAQDRNRRVELRSLYPY